MKEPLQNVNDAPAAALLQPPAPQAGSERAAGRRRWRVAPVSHVSSSVPLLPLHPQSFIESEHHATRAAQREDVRERDDVPGQGADHRHHEPHREEGGVRRARAHRAEGRGAGEGAQ